MTVKPITTGAALREWRAALGLSREQAAVALRLSYPTLVGYEQGRPMPPVVGLAAECLARLPDLVEVTRGRA